MKILQYTYSIFRNKYALFSVARYSAYGLQFLRSFVYAKILGPQLFGVWGLIMLYHQYLSFTTLGVQYSLNADLALNLEKKESNATSITASFFVVLTVGGFLFGLAGLAYLFGFTEAILPEAIGPTHILLLLVIIVLQHCQQLFTNIFRIHDQVLTISFTELLIAGGTLAAVFFAEGELLIIYYLAAWALTLLCTNVIYLSTRRFRFSPNVARIHTTKLLKVGIPLLVYNLSFHLMTLGSRTIVGIYYSIETLGLYSLAHTVSAAVLLGLEAFGWLFFPKAISLLAADKSDREVVHTINRISDVYATLGHLIIFATILGTPLLLIFLPEYKQINQVLVVLFLIQGLFIISYPHVTFAIARGKQAAIAYISMVSFVISLALGLLCAYLELPIVWIANSTFVGSVFFTAIIIQSTHRQLGSVKHSFKTTLLPWFTVPIFIVFLGGFIPYPAVVNLLAFSTFLYLNWRRLFELFGFIKRKLLHQ